MILIRIILGSALLYAFYHWVLRNEKTFRFNRIYLILALVFSYSVPFIMMDIPDFQNNHGVLMVGNPESKILNTIEKNSSFSTVDWQQLGIGIYFFISFLILVRAIGSIRKIINLKGEDVQFENSKIKLVELPIQPFGFWKTIYFNKTEYENSGIDKRIFIHEKAHIQQLHSLDLLFIELLIVCSWINPVLYFYRKAIMENHEFLADREVLEQSCDMRSYQNLILNTIDNHCNLKLTHSLYFNNIKKRLIIMKQQKSKNATIKNWMSLPFFVLLFFGLVQKTNAQQKVKKATKHELKNKANPKLIKSAPKKEKIEVSAVLIETNLNEVPVKKDSSNGDVVNATIFENNEIKPNDKNLSQPAEFPGGANSLRAKIANVFDMTKFDVQKGVLKTVVLFYIDDKGNLTNVIAEGTNEIFNTEAIRTAKFVVGSEKWKPATEEDKSVASVYKLPMTIVFE